MHVGLHGCYLDETEFFKSNNYRICELVEDYTGRDVTYMFWSLLNLWEVSCCLNVGGKPGN
ncbi:hypothetical protein U3516DRAFT_903779, partial [Neocallimastix sp. 'constans']